MGLYEFELTIANILSLNFQFVFFLQKFVFVHGQDRGHIEHGLLSSFIFSRRSGVPLEKEEDNVEFKLPLHREVLELARCSSQSFDRCKNNLLWEWLKSQMFYIKHTSLVGLFNFGFGSIICCLRGSIFFRKYDFVLCFYTYRSSCFFPFSCDMTL